jgi:ankyrin repeat protein
MDDQPFLSKYLPKKASVTINFDNQETAFKQLTENNASALRILVAREQRGKYCPDLYKAQETLQSSLGSEYMHWTFCLDRDTAFFVREIADKYNRYNKLMSILSYKTSCKYIEDFSVKCYNLLKKNRYTANTYGSYEPYQDRVITPLHYVLATYADRLLSDFNTFPFCNILLCFGANPNARDDAGNTPMHHASTPEQVRLLCQYGAKLNIKGEMGRTPLVNSIRLCNWPVVKCLLQHNANPNKQDDKGNTPLYLCIKKVNHAEWLVKLAINEIIELLLNGGAIMDTKELHSLSNCSSASLSYENIQKFNTYIHTLTTKKFGFLSA